MIPAFRTVMLALVLVGSSLAGGVLAQEAAPREAGPEGVSSAEPPLPAVDEKVQRERARVAYGRGETHFAAGEYVEAEAAFWEAYGAVPNPIVLLGIAEVRERVGNIVGAIEVLSRYLAEQPEAIDRASVEDRIAELRLRPAIFTVKSEPPGAEILVDNESTGLFTPAEIEVTPGRHAVTVRAQGWLATSRTVEAVIGGREEVLLSLEPAPIPDPSEEPFGTGEPIETEPRLVPDTGSDAVDGPSTGVWVATGIAATALVTGTVFGFMALAEQSQYDLEPKRSVADRGERLALFADISFGVALAAGVTAIVLHVTRDKRNEARLARRAEEAKRVSLAPAVHRTGAGLAARLEF